MRFIQHKKEAYWFYRFLSIFYDKYVNPLFWTEEMRDEALHLAQLDDPGLTVIDVGSGTGFTTQGIVQRVPARQVTCVDQSPHQMAKARQKADLQECTLRIGDAENIPFATDSFDRYVSAGSIEYWPDPQRGITEAYRVIKPGGIALLIGPLEPQEDLSRIIADIWMLFPKEKEYLEWFERAGFTDIRVRHVSPRWVRNKTGYGIAVAGVKPSAGLSPIDTEPVEEEAEESQTLSRGLLLAGRLLAGSLAGFLFIPVALAGYIRSAFDEGIPPEHRPRLNADQIVLILAFLLLAAFLLFWIKLL
jgi:MPBQ/MSBQ methyltransferase